jgi:hypothetical protein
MKDSIQKRIDTLKTQREQAIGAVQQITGAIAVCEDLLKELDAPVTEPSNT